jgi:acyl carrier protein
MNPPDPKIADTVREIVGEKILECPVAEVTDASLANLDSIGRITLMVELENAFNVELTGEEYDPEIFSAVDKMAAFVASKRG